MTAAEMQDLQNTVNSKFSAAVTAKQNHELLQSQASKDAVCAALQDLKDELNDAITAINDTMADIGCGA